MVASVGCLALLAYERMAFGPPRIPRGGVPGLAVAMPEYMNFCFFSAGFSICAHANMHEDVGTHSVRSFQTTNKALCAENARGAPGLPRE